MTIDLAVEPTDADLIRWSLRDADRFADVFERHFADIHRYAARRLGDATADDIAAETFLAAFGQRDRYAPERGPVRAWLFGIAANLIGRHRRTEVRALRTWARAGVDPVTECHSDEVVDRLSGGLDRRLAGALAGLAARDREVLLLVAWGDLSYEEVAAALRIPEGTVASRLNRVRRKLRTALNGETEV
ncbi:RNA polymerase sigma factor [Actinomycetes bacterium KLBMP 9797]